VCEQCDTTGVRLFWNFVRSLPNLVRVCINPIIIGCALVVFLCVTLFRVTVVILYLMKLCLATALHNAVNDADV
jgi:1,4-dihydroxy-2-naphthoate octaprenyltransferase